MEELKKPVIFKLDGEEYGVDISMVSGIEKYQKIIPVPNSQSYILGLINLRGTIVPVYSLRKKFNMGEFTGDNNERKMIIVHVGDILLALDVDSVSEIHDFSQANVESVPRIVKNSDIKYFNKVVNLNNRLIILIDVEYLLTEEELGEAKKLVEDMQA